MATQSSLASVCEVVGVFHNPEDLESAIDELLSSGFDRAELSLLASEDAVATKLGGYYRPAGDLADDPAVPRAAFVSTAAIGDAEGALIGGLAYVGATFAIGAVVMSGGALGAAVAAAALAGGAGGLIGSALAHWVGHHHAAYLHDQIENGGLLLWVRAWDEFRMKRARSRSSESMRRTRFTRAASARYRHRMPAVDAAHFRSRARQCRELARTARDAVSRRELNQIADELDAEAERIEAEESGSGGAGRR